MRSATTTAMVAMGAVLAIGAAAPPAQTDPTQTEPTQSAPSRSSRLAERFLAKAGKPAAEREGERVVSGDALVAVTVNGRPLHLHVEPGGPGLMLLAPAVREELGLRMSGFLGFGVCYRVGGERACGGTHVAKVGWGAEKPEKRRIGWMNRDYRPPADGTVGPAGLPERVIRFALRPPRAGEQTVTLPMHGGTGLFGGWFAIDGVMNSGGTPIHVSFDPYRPHSLATASAAVALAASQQGTMTAETGRQEILFGIERPYRMMKLGRPLVLGGLSLDRIGVRVTEGNIAGRIAEEGAAPEKADPDEVVVTAKVKKPRPGSLIFGADALARCSSIVFDKRAREIRLTCDGD